jgi:hypothetical protein
LGGRSGENARRRPSQYLSIGVAPGQQQYFSTLPGGGGPVFSSTTKAKTGLWGGQQLVFLLAAAHAVQVIRLKTSLKEFPDDNSPPKKHCISYATTILFSFRFGNRAGKASSKSYHLCRCAGYVNDSGGRYVLHE